MRPILLLSALLGSLALLYMVGNGMRHDRNNPQVVPHPITPPLP